MWRNRPCWGRAGEPAVSWKELVLAGMTVAAVLMLRPGGRVGGQVEVVDPVADYMATLREVFDFALLRDFLARPDFSLVFDAMHAVTGAYAGPILVDALGAPASSILCAHWLPPAHVCCSLHITVQRCQALGVAGEGKRSLNILHVRHAGCCISDVMFGSVGRGSAQDLPEHGQNKGDAEGCLAAQAQSSLVDMSAWCIGAKSLCQYA